MNFRDLELDRKYISYGDNSISDIIVPLLSSSKVYQRSVGYFSSSVLNFTEEGIYNLVRNKGIIQLITSPILYDEDIKAIENGYRLKENVYRKNFISEFESALYDLSENKFNLVTELISRGFLDIRIVKTRGIGNYHDKLAVLEDFDGNKVCFVGSSNSSQSGLKDNYEKIRVFFSWDFSNIYLVDEIVEFNKLWEGTNDYNETYNFMDAVKKSVIEVRQNRQNMFLPKQKEPWEYQKEPINNWIKNGYNGFFVMATGTGKTLTSLFSIRELFKKEKVFTVIAVPYKHLVSQWMDDVDELFPNSIKFKVAGEIPNWDGNIKNSLLVSMRDPNSKPIIVVSTISSFYSSRFAALYKFINTKKLLIVDEAHNFLQKIYEKKYFIDYEYKLGLSATPVFGKDEKKTKDLLNFFGGQVYNLPIEKAIGKYLVNYYYKPQFVSATVDDEKEFINQTRIMSSCYDKNGNLIDKDKFTIAYRKRLRCISMAENKLNNVANYIKSINEKDHFIIYCSDGKIGDMKHLNYVIDLLNKDGMYPSQFTASEDMKTRMGLINSFNLGDISALVAIRCLDEGINIPSIKTALLLSNNDNYREFVQRRGRILRKYEGKEYANIYDIIVLPSKETSEMAKIEFRRYYEYAKISLNKDSLLHDLEKFLLDYDLTMDDILFDNDYVYGGDLDE